MTRREELETMLKALDFNGRKAISKFTNGEISEEEMNVEFSKIFKLRKKIVKMINEEGFKTKTITTSGNFKNYLLNEQNRIFESSVREANHAFNTNVEINNNIMFNNF